MRKLLNIALFTILAPIILALIVLFVRPPESSVAENTSKCEWLYDKAYAAAMSADRTKGYNRERDIQMSEMWSALYLACRSRIDIRYQ